MQLSVICDSSHGGTWPAYSIVFLRVDGSGYFVSECFCYRRMEDAVKSVNEASNLCKKIVLGHRFDDLPGLNICFFAYKMMEPVQATLEYFIFESK